MNKGVYKEQIIVHDDHFHSVPVDQGASLGDIASLIIAFTGLISVIGGFWFRGHVRKQRETNPEYLRRKKVKDA